MLGQLSRTVGFILDHPIGRRHPVRCLGRLAGWQMRSRLSPGPHRIGYVGSTHLLARRGETGISGNIYVGLHEFADMAFVAHVLRPDDTFLDVGANAGSYTILAAGWCGTRAIAVEPVPETFTRLQANVASNDLTARVELHNCALGASEGHVTFTCDADTMNHVVEGALPGDAGTIDVPLRTVDDLLAGRAATVIKLDVEGYERQVLEGAGTTLTCREVQALLVEIFTDRTPTPGGPSTLEVLRAAGFTSCCYDPWQRKLTAEPQPRSGNVLVVRDLEWAARRLREAPPLPVLGEAV